MQYDQEVLVTYRKKDEVEMSTKNLKSLQTGIEPSVNEAESFEKKANVSESRFFIHAACPPDSTNQQCFRCLALRES